MLSTYPAILRGQILNGCKRSLLNSIQIEP